VPRASTEQKLQAVLDARAPGSYVSLWPSRRGNVTGRLSVPKEFVEASEEFKSVCSAEQGSWFFIGPHKVHLGLERSENVPLRKGHKAMQVSRLEKQMKALVNAVHSVVLPNASLTESLQQSLDIVPVPPKHSTSLPPKASVFSVNSSPNKRKSHSKKQRKRRKKMQRTKPVKESLMEIEEEITAISSTFTEEYMNDMIERSAKNLMSRLSTGIT